MPAYRQRIYICPSESGQPTQILDFPLWWDRHAFFNEYRGRQIDTGNPFYVDYGLLLSVTEAIAWDKHSRQELAGAPLEQKPHLVQAMDRLESLLKKASWVIVESYEWESGLE
jgi:hypothetical protein